MYTYMSYRIKKRKGMSTALAVVVGIIVLLVVAMAVIGVTTGSISQLGEKVRSVLGATNPTGIACSQYKSQPTCEANRMCEWKSNKCVSVGDKKVGEEDR